MSIQSLLNTLEQKVQQLTQAYQADSDKKINAKFNRTLFTEDFETAGFYLKEIQQSLTKLCSLPHQNEEQIVFMVEHLLGQCSALTEAMNRKYKKPIQPKIAEPQVVSSKSQHSIHRLPPRERLEKYYEALQQLTEKYEEAKAQANTAQTDIQRDMHKQTAAIYLTRRQKCLEAIETLEEYLAFKEAQESAVKK